MKHGITACILSLLVVLTGSSAAFGQSNNFWMNQHGNRARLLGGAMIGSSTDLSAVYYNPGALALLEKPEILLAGDLVEYRQTKVKNAVGESGSLDSTGLSISPSLLAGEFSNKKLRINRLAYSIMTRVNNSAGIRSRLQETRIEEFPDLNFFANDFEADQSIDETWMGLTYARKIRPNWGLGVSTFLAYRSHSVKIRNTAQGLNESGQGVVAFDTRDLSFNHYRLLWKFGMAGNWNLWKLGFSLTTPGIGLFGSGERRFDHTLISTIPGQDGNPITQVTTDTQKSDSKFHSPLSIGFGFARRFGDTYLHVSTEWFAPVSENKVLDIAPFVSQSTGETIDATPYQEFEQVFNFAVGVEHQLNTIFHLYGSFNTDFSATKDGSRVNISFPSIDLYHFSGGATFRVGRSEFTLGSSFGFGDNGSRARQPGDLLPEELSLSFRRIILVLGLNFSL